jgi:hypothetical protein
MNFRDGENRLATSSLLCPAALSMVSIPIFYSQGQKTS